MRCGHRGAEDDFFCDKYQVWYPLPDCNYRVLHRTYEGCTDCFQGRVNLRGLAGTSAPEAEAGRGEILRFPQPAAPSVRRSRLPGVLPPKG